MDRSTHQFLHLLRCELWGAEPSVELLRGDVSWSQILTQAQNHGVLPLVYASISRLPIAEQPSQEVMRRLHFVVTRNRQLSAKHGALLAEITQKLNSKPLLLKGLDSARVYPDPSLRACGDIDIYIGVADYPSVCDTLTDWCGGFVEVDGEDKHLHLQRDGVDIEIHHSILSPLASPLRTKAFGAWINSFFLPERLEECNFEWGRVSVLSRDFNLFYLFYHAWHHLEEDGVGLRHICDWALSLERYGSQIDWCEMRRNLERFNLLKAWQLFEYMSVELLGLDPQRCPYWSDEGGKFRQLMVRKILDGGNFGTLKSHQHKGGKLAVAAHVWSNIKILWCMDRAYALRYMAGAIWERVQRVQYRLRH